MMKYIALLLLINLTVQAPSEYPFKRVIILGMENHSYDNILGMMEEPIGELQNPEKRLCNEYEGKKYCQYPGAEYSVFPDPPHGFTDVGYQMFNTHDFPLGNEGTPNMQGFAAAFNEIRQGNPQDLFGCYTPEQIPVMAELAREFRVYDRWFCSVPTCTDPNKYFYHAGTSGGNVGNCVGWYCSGYPIKADTIYEDLQKDGFSWSIHWSDWCEAMALYPLNQQKDKFVHDPTFTDLFKKIDQGTLDDYTFIVPRIRWLEDTQDEIKASNNLNVTAFLAPNTQHPSEDLRYGELLIKNVYEHLRQSQYWNDTLLIITYDEHGGFPDHVPPPANVKNPSPNEKSQKNFEFERLGPRVPGIAISPWIKHDVISDQFSHASVPHTVREIFNLSSDYLTIREKEAANLVPLSSLLDEPRTDCPETLPMVPFLDSIPLQYSKEKMNGTPYTQMNVLGTFLVQQGHITKEKLFEIRELIEDEKEAGFFIDEALSILGYKKVSNRRFRYLQKPGQKNQETVEQVEI